MMSSGSRARAERQHIGLANVGLGETEPVGIGADRVDGGAVLFDEGAVGRAARQRLEAQRAGAGEEIADAQPFESAEAAGQHGEQRLARAVGGRAGRRRPAGAISGRPRHSPAMIRMCSVLLAKGLAEGPRSCWRTSIDRARRGRSPSMNGP